MWLENMSLNRFTDLALMRSSKAKSKNVAISVKFCGLPKQANFKSIVDLQIV